MNSKNIQITIATLEQAIANDCDYRESRVLNEAIDILKARYLGEDPTPIEELMAMNPDAFDECDFFKGE